ncbi:hypothetical protein BCR34DRAFT_160491 [Clohesyomyces aquaticus]|uniref:Uncharacterized protein n=1 Tax=Clohesyomyces aquaticus TaxID=1231657 RepID=A0A1Y1YIF0_9PLEO|nr:hypothetical protein BCR34DRAFT_160491 [Clohesyomyces aquaticus]
MKFVPEPTPTSDSESEQSSAARVEAGSLRQSETAPADSPPNPAVKENSVSKHDANSSHANMAPCGSSLTAHLSPEERVVRLRKVLAALESVIPLADHVIGEGKGWDAMSDGSFAQYVRRELQISYKLQRMVHDAKQELGTSPGIPASSDESPEPDEDLRALIAHLKTEKEKSEPKGQADKLSGNGVTEGENKIRYALRELTTSVFVHTRALKYRMRRLELPARLLSRIEKSKIRFGDLQHEAKSACDVLRKIASLPHLDELEESIRTAKHLVENDSESLAFAFERTVDHFGEVSSEGWDSLEKFPSMPEFREDIRDGRIAMKEQNKRLQQANLTEEDHSKLMETLPAKIHAAIVGSAEWNPVKDPLPTLDDKLLPSVPCYDVKSEIEKAIRDPGPDISCKVDMRQNIFTVSDPSTGEENMFRIVGKSQAAEHPTPEVPHTKPRPPKRGSSIHELLSTPASQPRGYATTTPNTPHALDPVPVVAQSGSEKGESGPKN